MANGGGERPRAVPGGGGDGGPAGGGEAGMGQGFRGEGIVVAVRHGVYLAVVVSALGGSWRLVGEGVRLGRGHGQVRPLGAVHANGCGANTERLRAISLMLKALR